MTAYFHQVHCHGRSARLFVLIAASLFVPMLRLVAAETSTDAAFDKSIRPLLSEYCLKCHSTEKHKGDLDLERFSSLTEVRKHPKIWQMVAEQVGNNEMPPKEKPQPPPDQRQRLLTWLNGVLDEIALARAGDPGPVVLRRLSNAEYTYTIRDLTGVESFDPAREFPVDSAAGEGFMNVGNSLVMSPSLITKYLDAGKEIASHAVLLPDGIRFSPKKTRRDWTEEILAEIRSFYRDFTDPRGGDKVNLQGIVFETNEGGRLPLEKYLLATIHLRDRTPTGDSRIETLNRPASLPLPKGEGRGEGEGSVLKYRGLESKVRFVGRGEIILEAEISHLSPKYLLTLLEVLTSKEPSLLLDPIRARWRSAKAADVTALAADIAQWQKALWKFNSVGHIGKVGGPTRWMDPIDPLTMKQEVRLKLPALAPGNEVRLYLVAGDAGDGNANDFVVWEQPRLVAPGRPNLLLRDVRELTRQLTERREKIFASTAKSLAAASEASAAQGGFDVNELAQKHGIEIDALKAWLNYLGIGSTGELKIQGYFTDTMKNASTYDFIKGWGKSETPNVVANSSDQHVRIPGNMKPHGVAVHPSPKLQAAVGWRSPITGTFRVEAKVQHAHPECGNGVTWSLELRRGATRQRLAAGIAQGGKEVTIPAVDQLFVQSGDLVSLLIGPRDGNHSCDLTAIDLALTDVKSGREWNLANDVSPDVLAGNPHADRFGNEGIWHFYTEPDKGGSESGPVIPAGSLLAKWQATSNSEDKIRIANAVQALLTSGTPPAKDSADGKLYQQLSSLGGPLFAGMLRNPSRITYHASRITNDWALDSSQFGKHPNGRSIDSASLCVQAPSVIEVRLPADLVPGCEFVTTGVLDNISGIEGSVQLQVLTNKPSGSGLVASAVTVTDASGQWTSDNRKVSYGTPIVVSEGSSARKRIEASFNAFREIFPAALCYTKIVPVDEVVTLTLYYREDHHLARLMLDDAQKARLDRLWEQLHYVSHDALMLVDVLEQLYQYATQDADPKVFEPLREPFKQRAAAFRQQLIDTEPKHLQAVLDFADRAYRRPLTDAEKNELRGLYRKLRDQELPHEEAIRLTLARVFVAPAFLYRAENSGPGSDPGPVSDWQLATRLSYFLWSSVPDSELREAAASEKLQDPEILARQTSRMLQDARVRRLAIEFGCAWLHIHDFDELNEKSERHFPTFTELRSAMYEESILFFTDFFQNDRSVLNILDADYTFLNESLAKHYGIPAVKGTEWRRVDDVKKFARGGVLAQATTLAKQSGASRTSPILRGNWICEVLLGEKLPRPPKDVPRLPEDETATEGLTVRQLVEKHSSDPRCAGCHVRIDPYGFALERFDAIGRHRERDLADRPIETKAKVLNGTQFDGLDGLRDYLLTKRRDAFLKQFCRKLLGYALGRSVQLSDSPLLTEMQSKLTANGFHITSAVETIVRSRQFREIRGREFAVEE